MDHNQRTSKSRGQDLQKQTKKLDNVHKSRGGISGSQNVVASAAVNEDFLRQQFAPVSVAMKGVSAASASPVPTPVKIQRGPGLVHHTGVPGQVMILKTEKDDTFSSAAELTSTPSHTTKSSSLSRDISPSRITAQVVSAMSESTQPLLLSALTGKMPAPLMLGTTAVKSEASADIKYKQADSAGLRTSPYNLSERRPSPVPVDRRMQTESKGVKVQPVPTGLPFENLMRAAALAQAQDAHGRSSPGRPSAGAQQHQGLVAQLTEGRTKTPSPKPVSAVRSPQRHGTQQGQRRSPMTQGSRPSPVPSPGQEVLAAMSVAGTASGGVMIPVQQMGLVQQHLLAGTLASTTIATSSIPSTMAKSGPSHSPHTIQHPRVPAAPSAPSAAQSTVKLATIPIDMSALSPGQKAKSTKNSHVISVGTGTEARRYASHGAQTKHVSSHPKHASNAEEIVIVKREEAVFQGQNKEDGVKVTGTPRRSPSRSVSPSGTCSGTTVSRVSPVMSAVGVSNNIGISHSNIVTLSRPFTTLSSFSSLSSAAADHNTNSTSVMSEHRKWHVPLPTPAHGNKPIPVPFSHAHVHIHHSSTHSRPHIPVTSASVAPSTVSHVSSTPVTQPVVSLCRLPTTTSSVIQSSSMRVKSETKAASGLSSSQAVTSANYQPHHHHYHHQTQPPQTITSQMAKSGPVVKDFIPVVGPPEPPPYHQPPLPPHVNPFTFPTSGVKVHYSSGDGPSYSLIGQDNDVKVFEGKDSKDLERKETQFSVGHKSVSDVTGLRKVMPFSETANQRDDMPRLTPENWVSSKSKDTTKTGTFNHVDPAVAEGKEQLTSPFNQRLQNLNNFPSMVTAYRSAYRSQSVAMQRAKAGIIMGAAKSLDLLRQNIQKNINKELSQIVQKYVEKFFRPAADNIRINNGADAVSEEHVNTVCRQIFEEAKRMYTAETRRSMTPISDFPDNVSESGSLNGKRVSPNPLSKRLKASDSDSEKGSDGGLPKKIPRRKGRPPLNSSGRSTPLKPAVKMDNIKREGPKWDPERVKPDTLFVMGARANKALGLGNTRGRLYIRHPDVFKYSGDQEDKIWLHEQKLMPATGGKAYMLIVEDIIDLSKTEEYRDSPTLMMHECRGFEVPEWMRIKIKESMRALRSDGPKRSRSRSPLTERPEVPKTLPFSNFSDTASNNDLDSVGNKNSLQPSPADTEEIEFLSAVDNEDTQPSDISAFNMTGGFEDTSSHSPCPMEAVEDEPSIAAPFT